MGSERRHAPRVDRSLSLKICKENLDFISETKNISSSGIYCRINGALPLMTKVAITLLLPVISGSKTKTRKIKCNGVIVRSEPAEGRDSASSQHNVAIFFTELAKADRDKIAQYVNSSLG